MATCHASLEKNSLTKSGRVDGKVKHWNTKFHNSLLPSDNDKRIREPTKQSILSDENLGDLLLF
ncbi:MULTISPECIES: hypothetical protein [unclassified Bartonella]|uniref:hypothetical protein n=1 Tax=unclassified Bartonella TaxID=2645622 RepID=UPI002361B06C|nr:MULTISPECIES: hypothetical protein [unclassified Bartonella]